MSHNFEVGKKYSVIGRTHIIWEPVYIILDGVLFKRVDKKLNNRTTYSFHENRFADSLWGQIKELEPEVVEHLYWVKNYFNPKHIYALVVPNSTQVRHLEDRILSGPHEIRYQPE